MDFTFEYEVGQAVHFRSNRPLQGTVTGLLVDRQKAARYLIQWWDDDNRSHSEYFHGDDLA